MTLRGAASCCDKELFRKQKIGVTMNMETRTEYGPNLGGLLILGVISIVALVLGVFLTTQPYYTILLSLGAIWLIAVPQHLTLAMVIATVTFQSSVIIPFVPGRPFFWELGAFLGWTGVATSLAMGRRRADVGRQLVEQKWIVIGLLIYCVTLIGIMLYRGAGLKIFGAQEAGGRAYFQQILCVILPVVFIVAAPGERTVLRLFVAQLALTCTYLISELAFTIRPDFFGNLLYFFELSSDMANFAEQSLRFGIYRLQSFKIAAPAIIFLLLIKYSVRDFLSPKGLWLVPLVFILFMMGMLSGHREAVLLPLIILTVFAWSQRLFDPRRLFILFSGLVLILAGIYTQSERLPYSVQRALSFLPGIKLNTYVAMDARGTAMVRWELTELGLHMIPDYLLVGRGFTRYLGVQSPIELANTIDEHLTQGHFYNGFVGLLVDTGLAGALGAMMFFYGGLRLCARVFGHVRKFGASDPFSRASALIASTFASSVFYFLIVNGNITYGTRYFMIPLAMLIPCDRLLSQRRLAWAGGVQGPAGGEPQAVLKS